MNSAKLYCWLVLAGLLLAVLAGDLAGNEWDEGSASGQDEGDVREGEQSSSNNSQMVLVVVQTPPKKITFTQAEAHVSKWEVERTNSTPVNSTEDINSNVMTKGVATKCVSGANCFGDSDCVTGRCLGIAVGKCNCGVCFTFLPCRNDAACGGLRGACDNQTRYCDCDKGFRANGFQTIFDAARLLCNVKDCSDRDSCYGLPCNSGFCAC